jgi:hypothetical protein
MKITTEAHGAFPTDKFLKASGPRIAFVNSDEFASYLRASKVAHNVLVIAADDISEDAIPGWIQRLLKLPATFSYVVKRHLWKGSRAQGFPSAPMSHGDAQAIMDFYRELETSGVDHLVISCEYGKSRSVTTANFIREHLQFIERDANYPNKWVRDMLQNAFMSEYSTKNMPKAALDKIESYKQARREFIECLAPYGGTLKTAEVARMLGLSETAVVGEINADRLLGVVSTVGQEYLVPAFQFHEGRKIAHLESLISSLGDIPDYSACTWFLQPVASVGVPLEALKAGVTLEQLWALTADAKAYCKKA